MAIIHYIKTTFIEPGPISQETYLILKLEISRNPKYKISLNSETFWEHFRFELKIIKICGIGICLAILIGTLFAKKDNWADTLSAITFGLSFFVIICVIIRLGLEGPSFSDYLINKEKYISKMKNVILDTNSYSEFISLFYKR